MTFFNRSWFNSGVAVFAVIAATPAFSQDAQPEDGDSGIEEIVVTARKRAESLQETPISITAFTSREISARGLDDVSEISQSTPNLVFDGAVTLSGSSASSSVTIRGVGQTDFTFNADPGVGTYVDGVYISRSVGGLINLLDIERVEVLRGPQGTLFGKNSTGGAVNITTVAPDNTFSGKLGLKTGRYNRADVTGSFNIPISATLAARVSGAYRSRDGYVERLQGGEDYGSIDSLTGRIRLRWEASEKLTIDLTADGTRDRQSALPIVIVSETINPLANPFAAAFNATAQPMGACFAPSAISNPACFNSQFLAGSFATFAGNESRSNLDLLGASAAIEYALSDELTFKSISAYRTFDSDTTFDLDGSPHVVFDGNILQKLDAYSQEFQLLGNMIEGRLNWIIGAYYLDEKGSHVESIDTAIGNLNVGGVTRNKSKAVFAQATFDFTKRLSLTAGVRYTDEDRTYNPNNSFFLLSSGRLDILPARPFTVSAKETTPLANLSYRFTDNLNAYVTYSQGFKSGGFSQRITRPLAAPPSFTPEFVDLYEFGLKFQSSDSRVRINTAMFQSDYSDVQVLGLVPGVVGAATTNAGEARIRGAEVEITVVPVEAMQLEVGMGYLDAEYTRLDAAVIGIGLNDPLPNTPELTLSASASYKFALSERVLLTPRIDWSFQDKVSNVATNIPALIQKGYHLFNASATLSLDEKWRLSIGVKNLTDKTYLVSGNDTVALGTTYGTFGLPRTWSLGIDYEF